MYHFSFGNFEGKANIAAWNVKRDTDKYKLNELEQQNIIMSSCFQNKDKRVQGYYFLPMRFSIEIHLSTLTQNN